MHHFESRTSHATEPQVRPGNRTNDEVATLKGENVALQSLLYGLCLGLSQMGEVQREVILQAFDYADRCPMAAALKDNERSLGAFASTMANLRNLVVARIRSVRS
jgi:hypothetical protein